MGVIGEIHSNIPKKIRELHIGDPLQKLVRLLLQKRGSHAVRVARVEFLAIDPFLKLKEAKGEEQRVIEVPDSGGDVLLSAGVLRQAAILGGAAAPQLPRNEVVEPANLGPLPGREPYDGGLVETLRGSAG